MWRLTEIAWRMPQKPARQTRSVLSASGQGAVRQGGSPVAESIQARLSRPRPVPTPGVAGLPAGAARARDRQHDHSHAVRILARTCLHTIWRCWQDEVAYDPAKHGTLQALLNQDAGAAA
jgi:hypothetical protein